MEENKNNVTDGIEFIEMEPEIKEFVRKAEDGKRYADKAGVQDRLQASGFPVWLWSAGFLAVLLAVVSVGILLCKEPAVTVIAVVLLEVLLAICLCKSPVWLHGLFIVMNVALGFWFHMTVFMILACAVYIAGIWVLHVLNKG